MEPRCAPEEPRFAPPPPSRGPLRVNERRVGMRDDVPFERAPPPCDILLDRERPAG